MSDDYYARLWKFLEWSHISLSVIGNHQQAKEALELRDMTAQTANWHKCKENKNERTTEDK
jgi:hypothetical protein